jgi:hypothetical protein
MAQLEAQCQQLAEEETGQRELPMIVDRLDVLAAQVQQNRADLAWPRKRESIRALVRPVAMALDQVRVVVRVDAFPGETDPEKKACNFVRGVVTPPGGVPIAVPTNIPLSRTPALSHAFTSRFRVGNVLIYRSRASWSMRSNHVVISASKAYLGCFSIAVKSAPMASCTDRPGWNPPLWGSNRASQPGSRASLTRAWSARSWSVGIDSGRLSSIPGFGIHPRLVGLPMGSFPR